MKIFSVAFTPEAEREALASYFWYEKQRKGLGEIFKISLDLKIESLKENPESASFVYQDIRSSKIKKFPFNIIFRLRNSQLQIIAVFHYSRNPAEWQRRI